MLEDSNDDEAALSDYGSKPRTPIDIGIIEEHEDEQNVTLKDIRKDESCKVLNQELGEVSPINYVKTAEPNLLSPNTMNFD